MSKLDHLEQLAKAAIGAADIDEPQWYEFDALMYSMGHEDDARYTASANPATILAMIALLRQMRESLSHVRQDLVLRAQFDFEDGGKILNIGSGVLRVMDEALSAFDAFNGDKDEY